MLTALMLMAIIYIFLFVPESPLYLNEIKQYGKLKRCLERISYINQVQDRQNKVKYCLYRLKIKNFIYQKIQDSQNEKEEIEE